jgi:hypothetical protein
LTKMVEGGADAMILGTFVLPNLGEVVPLAALHKLPAMYGNRQFVQDGGLMSYGADRMALFRRISIAYVARIFKGINQVISRSQGAQLRPWPNTFSGALMGRVNLSFKVIAAFRNAGATEKMIAGALGALGARVSGSVGRPRKYKNRSECDHAYYERRKQRARKCEEIHRRLIDAAQGNVDPLASIPIRALLAQGCEHEPRRAQFFNGRGSSGTVPATVGRTSISKLQPWSSKAWIGAMSAAGSTWP